MMKRTISIIAFTLVCVMLALSLAACGGDKVPAGSYKATEVTGNADASWKTASISVQEDGNATVSRDIEKDGMAINQFTGVVFKDGKMKGGSYDFSYTCKDGKLTLKVDGGEVIFEKQ